ncbi:hypothetical protein BO94DRAFT_455116, partial [Aspergillus sclerotioniger CBS 115572]
IVENILRNMETDTPGQSIFMNNYDNVTHLLQELNQWKQDSSIITQAGRVLDLRTGFGLWAMYFADNNPDCEVFGVDFVYMQPSSVPPNCEFHIIDLTRSNWWEMYTDISLVHINDLGGDISLLRCLLAGAFKCSMPCGVVELHGITFDLYNQKSWLYGFYKSLRAAYWKDGRRLDLPNRIPLMVEYSSDLQKRFLKTWFDGLEALALDLMTKHLGWTHETILLKCALARGELLKGTHGYLTIWNVYGSRPNINLQGL